jgi:predicted lipoprotein with Yx(FWY)xxD motif
VKRLVAVLIAVALVASLPIAFAGASGHAAKLHLHTTKLGAILVNRHGFTLYAFTKDTRNHDACAKITQCLPVWPAVTTSCKPIAGHGVKKSLIGTITLKHGVKQVTYAGHPLYTYVADTGPAQTSYVNYLQFGGRWPAVSASGALVK